MSGNVSGVNVAQSDMLNLISQKKNLDKDVVKNMDLISIFNTVNKAVKEGVSPEEAINKESNKIDKELENANKQKEILENKNYRLEKKYGKKINFYRNRYNYINFGNDF